MNNKQNLHVHTTFCDGRNTPEEIVNEALLRGFDSIGFSMHSYLSCTTVGISPEKIESYKLEIKRLKEKYKDHIKLFLGVEQDFYSDSTTEGFEYNLLAVHYLMTDAGRRTFDSGLESTKKYIDEHFSGNGMSFAKKYYETLALAADTEKYGRFDIIAHIDLVAKNNEKGGFFDEDSKEYLSYASDAIDALKGKIDLFEVNTGAVARGYKTSFYPKREILDMLRDRGFGAVISSDCHNMDYLDFGFEDAAEYLREAGFKSRFILTESGFAEVGL